MRSQVLTRNITLVIPRDCVCAGITPFLSLLADAVEQHEQRSRGLAHTKSRVGRKTLHIRVSHESTKDGGVTEQQALWETRSQGANLLWEPRPVFSCLSEAPCPACFV